MSDCAMFCSRLPPGYWVQANATRCITSGVPVRFYMNRRESGRRGRSGAVGPILCLAIARNRILLRSADAVKYVVGRKQGFLDSARHDGWFKGQMCEIGNGMCFRRKLSIGRNGEGQFDEWMSC